MSERLTEREMIDREIGRVESIGFLGPYRKGIIAGLASRKGETIAAPAHYTDASVRTWSAGFEVGVFRDLRTYDERAQDGDA